LTQYQIMYWHDIPLQVRAGGRRDRASQELPERFQVAIDKAAMAAGVTGSDAYTDGFYWGEAQERPGTPAEVAAAVAAELDAAYQTIDWRRTAAALNDGK